MDTRGDIGGRIMPRWNGTDPNDEKCPGPIDFCRECWEFFDYTSGEETDHPSYDDDFYTCYECGTVLLQRYDK